MSGGAAAVPIGGVLWSDSLPETQMPPGPSDAYRGPVITYQWRGDFASTEVEALHADGFGRAPGDYDWKAQVEAHSLGWVCARCGAELAGFVNVAWDGGVHAFILDTLVARPLRRGGVGTRLIEVAARQASAAGCEWLHVDFEDYLGPFYFGPCKFQPTNAGLIRLDDRA
jgi:GNAT superfamily N-acetyltransferase